jgi:hypothetical protein
MSKLTKALAPFDNQVSFENNPLPLRPCNFGIFARKGMGKTTLLLNILSRPQSPWYKHFNKIFLISPTASKDDKMKELCEDIGEQYYDELNQQNLASIIEKIDFFTEEFKKKRKNKGKKPNFCIIYDDVIHELKRNNKLFNLLATQNRHRCITNIYLLQKYNTYLPTIVRSNLDVISYFRTDNKKELESFIDEMSEDENKLRAFYEFATSEPYSFLHINMYNYPTRFYKKFDLIEFRKK